MTTQEVLTCESATTMLRPEDVEQCRHRFFAKTKRSDAPPPPKLHVRCLHWIGAKTDGYGVCRVGDATFRAHRVAVVLDGRELRDTDVMEHLCHHRGCVEPTHLLVSTQAANMKSMVEAGRSSKGVGSRRSPTPAKDAAAIVWFKKLGFTLKQTMEAFDRSMFTVSAIRGGRSHAETINEYYSGVMGEEAKE